MTTPPTLNLTEAALRLGVHRATVRRWIRRGLVPAVRYGRSWRIATHVVDRIAAGAF